MEEVIRIRRSPGGWDANGDRIESTVTRTPLRVRGVAPGASKRNAALARRGESIEYSLYFVPAVDLTNDDQIEVRGLVCECRVEDWRSAFGTGRSGMVALAVTERG